MDNSFLQMYLPKIEKLKTYLIELEMMGQKELPVAEIRHLFDGMVLEISKLQGENKELIKLVNQQQNPQTPEVKKEVVN